MPTRKLTPIAEAAERYPRVTSDKGRPYKSGGGDITYLCGTPECEQPFAESVPAKSLNHITYECPTCSKLSQLDEP